MKQVFILRGLPGSGKSYYAQNLAEELSGADETKSLPKFRQRWSFSANYHVSVNVEFSQILTAFLSHRGQNRIPENEYHACDVKFARLNSYRATRRFVSTRPKFLQ